MIRYAAPLALFVLLAALLASGLGKDPRIVPSPLIDQPAPSFELPNLGAPEQVVQSTDLQGKPYVLNVWASWCAACRIEHPVVEALAASGRVDVIGLNWKDQPDDARQWLRRFGDPYRVNLMDQDGRVGIEFGVYGAPETFLIDAGGVIRFKWVGPLTDEIIQREILPRLESRS